MIFRKEVKSVLNKHKKRDSWFLDDYSVNPYEGCGFNCQYCYTRGSKYGENLAEKLTIKINAPAILDRQLKSRAKKNQYGIIAVGSATDAYMQMEEEHRQTRKMLEVILQNRFPVFISTKSTLVLRDLDILGEINRQAILPEDLKTALQRGVIISFSFSTLDEELARILEPGAPSPLERLETLRTCSQYGFKTGLNAIPLLPFISDTDEELERMIKAASDYGADYILAGGLTLFGDNTGDCKTLYYRFLKNHFPHLLSKYEELFAGNYYAPWHHHNRLKKKTEALCRKYGIKNSII